MSIATFTAPDDIPGSVGPIRVKIPGDDDRLPNWLRAALQLPPLPDEDVYEGPFFVGDIPGLVQRGLRLRCRSCGRPVAPLESVIVARFTSPLQHQSDRRVEAVYCSEACRRSSAAGGPR